MRKLLLILAVLIVSAVLVSAASLDDLSNMASMLKDPVAPKPVAQPAPITAPAAQPAPQVAPPAPTLPPVPKEVVVASAPLPVAETAPKPAEQQPQVIIIPENKTAKAQASAPAQIQIPVPAPTPAPIPAPAVQPAPVTRPAATTAPIQSTQESTLKPIPVPTPPRLPQSVVVSSAQLPAAPASKPAEQQPEETKPETIVIPAKAPEPAPTATAQPAPAASQDVGDIFGSRMDTFLAPPEIVLEDHSGAEKAPAAITVLDPATGKPTSLERNKRYDISLNISKERRIVISNALVTGATLPVRLEELGSEMGFRSVVAIDLAGLDFANATYYMTAKGYELFKCKLWNYTAQECNGDWVKIKDTVPGKTYAIKLGPDDPALADSGGVFFDGFENGLSANNWTINGTGNKWTNTTTNPYNGTRHAQANQPTASTSMRVSINTSGYSTISVSYARRLVGLDIADEFAALWYNGTVWSVLEQTGASAANDANYIVRNYTLGPSAGNKTIILEFMCMANLANEYCRVDDVRVNSTSIADPDPPSVTWTNISRLTPYVGDSVCLLANVTDKTGVKSVIAQIRLPSGANITLPLYDDLTCNSPPGDSVYSNHLMVTAEGTYNWTTINTTDTLNNAGTFIVGKKFTSLLGMQQENYRVPPNLSRYDNGTIINAALINTSNDVYAAQDLPKNSETYMYFNWTLNISGDIVSSNATIEHSYSSTAGVTVDLQIKNSTTWQNVCYLTVSASDVTNYCDLAAFVQGNASVLNRLELRTHVTTGNQARTQYVDYVALGYEAAPPGSLTKCDNITSSKTLGKDITSGNTCVIFGADNIALDCSNYAITYGTAGTWGLGISAPGRKNITIKNCRIRDTNASGSFGVGIYLENTNSSTIANTTIITNGTEYNHGILVQGPSSNNTIANSTILVSGRLSFNTGIYLMTGATGTAVIGNTVNTSGNGSGHAILIDSGASNNIIRNNAIRTSGSSSFNIGIFLLSSTTNITIENNTVRTNGTGSDHGILLQTNANNNTIANNTILTAGNNSFNAGIYLLANASENKITGNRVNTSGTTDNTCILLENEANSNIVENNTVRSRGSGASNEGIELIGPARNNSIAWNTIITNGTTTNHGIQLQNGANSNTIANNTVTSGGSANFNVGIIVLSSSLENLLANNSVSTSGTDSDHGFFITDQSDNTTIALNNIAISGVSSYGIGIENISAITLSDNILANPDFEFHIFNSSETSISGDFGNYSFEDATITVEKKGKSKVKFNKKITGKGKKLKSAITLEDDGVFVNNTAQEFNVSANITIFGINATDFVIDADFGDNDFFEECPETICTIIQNSQGEKFLRVGVSHFTKYRILPAIVKILVNYPANASGILLNESVNITANITPTGSRKLDIIQANLTLPDGTVIELPFLNVTKDIFNYSLTTGEIVQRGKYNLTFFANDSKNIRKTTFSFFARKAYNIIDIVNSTNAFASYAPTVLSNRSGVLNLTIAVQNGRIKTITADRHHESSVNSRLRIDDLGGDGLVSARRALDTTAFNSTEVNMVVNATGTSVFKCIDWDFENRNCNGGWEKKVHVSPGQLYNIKSTEPEAVGYGEGNNAVDVLDRNKMLQSFTELADANPDSTNNVTLTVSSHPIKKIELKHADTAQSNDLRIDTIQAPEQFKRDIVQQYAIDTGSLSFTEGSITVTAKGTRLRKCALWNITTQQCDGSWADYMSLTPGQQYTVAIGPGDPAFQEINATDAWHLDTNRQVIENIFSAIYQNDNVFSPQILHNEYARARFSRNLTNNNTIDFVARAFGSGGVYVEIYPAGSDTLVARSGWINDSTAHYYLRLGMNDSEAYDTFDIKTISDPMNISSYVEYDLIHDEAELEAGILQVYQGGAVVGPVDTYIPIGGVVDTTRSILFFSTREYQGSPSNGEVAATILNSTHIWFIHPAGAVPVNVTWYVAEFGRGLQVQRGLTQPAATTTYTKLAAPINETASFMVPSGYNNTGTIWGEDDLVRFRIVNSTDIELRTYGATTAGDVAGWQVVEFNGSVVQRGLIDMPSTTRVLLVNLTTPVNLSRSFILASYGVSGTLTGANSNIISKLVNATQIEFNRNGTGISANISWEVVELPVPNTVQYGIADFDTTTTVINATLSTINVSQSVAFASSAPIAGLSMGNSSLTGDDNPGAGMFTLNITNSTNLQIMRYASGGFVSSVQWFVVNFAAIIPRFNYTNMSVAKTDFPDPVNISSNLTYQITVTATGNGTSFNVTVNETYSTLAIYLASSPAPVAGTNNSWLLGNLTNGTVRTINITVFTLNATNGTILNNTVNVTFQNETGAFLSVFVRQNTTLIRPPGQLNATLLSPVPNIVTNVTQYTTFNMSANITCTGEPTSVCGNVTSYSLYNTTWNLSGNWFNTSYMYRLPVTFRELQGRPQNYTHVLFNVTLPANRLFNENGTMLVCGGVQVPFDAYALAYSGSSVTSLEGLTELNFSAMETKECALYYDPYINATEVLPSQTGWDYACASPYAYCGQPGLTNVTPQTATYYGNYSNISMDPVTCGAATDYFTHSIWCYFKAPRSGNISFALGSDDGSMLFINNSLVVDNRGCQATTCRSGNTSIFTQSRYYSMKVAYDEYNGGSTLYAVYDPLTCAGVPTGNYIDTECYQYYGDAWQINGTPNAEQNLTQETFVNISTLNGATPFFTTNANPQYCNLVVGQSCQLNWTVNATGAVNSDYKIRVNVSSNISGVAPALTENTTIKIIAVNNPPNISAVLLNSTNNYINDTDQNLTRYVINATDPENNAVQNITDWRMNNKSIALLNMPFETNVNSLTTGAIRDYSLNGNNGTLGAGTAANAPVWNSSGKIGGSYTFDGIDDFIQVSGLLSQPASATISAWVNWAPKSTDAEAEIVSLGDHIALRLAGPAGTPYNGVYGFYYDGTTWQMTDSGIYVNGTGWHHVAYTFNNATKTQAVYVDGVLAGSTAHALPIIYTGLGTNTFIGKHGNGGATWDFNGTIDEVIVFNRSVSAEQILQLYVEGNASIRQRTIVSNETITGEVWQACVTPNDNKLDGATVCSNNLTIRPRPYIRVNFTTPTPANDTYTLNRSVVINMTIDSTGSLAQFVYNWNGTNYTVLNESLVLLYNFNNLTALGENSTTVADISNYGNTGTIYGDVDWTSSGKYGGAYRFHGIGDYIDAGSGNGLNITGEITLAAWINLAQLGIDQKIIGKQSGTSGGYKMGIFTNNKAEMEVRDAANTPYLNRGVAGGTVLQAGVWYCIMGVYSQAGGYIATYVNGELDRNFSTAGVLAPTTGNLNIGREPFAPSLYFNGTIDGVYIWRKALTPDEIRENCMYTLQKINMTAWYFYVNQSLNATDGLDFGDYNYSGCGKDFANNVNCTLTQIIHIRPRNASNMTVVKTDSPDPVNVSQNLTYVINVTSTGPGRAFNVTVNDTYSTRVIYLTSSPTPITGTNNTWIIGNLTANQSVLINITVFTLNVSNGTLINNTVNVSFQNETSILLNTSTTINTTVIVPVVAVFNFSNISVTKTDNPDPVNANSNLTYQINVTSNGNGTAYNVTVNDTYSTRVIYLTSQPTPLTGTNNTWILGNLTPGTNRTINITVFVLNITNGTLINNTVNVSYNNETGILLNRSTTINTTVLSYPQYNFSNISITKTDFPDPVNKSQNLTYQINVSSTGNGTAYNVTVNDTYSTRVIYLASQPTPVAGTNNYWVLGNLTPGSNRTINITVLAMNITNGTLINNTANISYNNETGALLNISTIINTTVQNRPPNITQVILNTTNPLTNNTDQNLTVYVINATDPDDQIIQNITDWQLNNSAGFASIAVLNMPFETNIQRNTAGAIRDYSTYGNNGTLTGSSAANIPIWTASGKVGGAYDFDGTNRIINVSDSLSLDNTNKLTISAWVYPRVLDTSARGVISKRVSAAAGQAYSLFFYTGIKLAVDIVGTDNRFFTNNTFSVNQWYHIVVVYDGTLAAAQRVKVYINGTLDTVGAETAATIPDYASDLTIGALNAGYGTYYNGTIDEVLILNRSLSPEQVWQLYVNGNNSLHLMTIVPPETNPDELWQTCVTPNDNQTDGNTICSNTVLIKPKPLNFSNISITKTDFPDPVNASSNLTYQINVSSTGNGTAYNVTVNDTYSTRVIYLTSSPTPIAGTNNTWLFNLTPGMNISINITVFTLNVSNGTLINNTVNVSFQNETGIRLNKSTTINTTVLNPPLFNISNISVTKTDFPDPVNVSSNLTYQINVSSTGNGTAYNVTVNDTYSTRVIYLASQPTPLTGTNNTWLFNLTPGMNISINITVFTLNVSNGTLINNTVNASFNNETGARLNRSTTINTTVLSYPLYNFTNISVTKTDFPDPVNASSNLTYQINISSTGNGTAFNVTVNDTYSTRVIYLASQPTPLTGTNNTWNWTILSPGTNISINITVFTLNVTNGTLINNTVNVSFNNETGARLNRSTTINTTVVVPFIQNTSNITVVKTDSPDPVNVSSNLTYVINVTSTGPGRAFNVTVNDTYSTRVIYLTSSPTPLTGTNNTWIIGNLTANQSVLINITVFTLNVSNGTLINNTVNVSWQNETSIRLNASTTINTTVLSYPRYNNSNISVVKTDNPDPVNVSSNLTYVINVTSNGNGTAYNVTVNDTYSTRVIYLTSSPTPLAGTNNTWIIGNLTPGISVLINITVFTLNVSNGTLLNNTVNVSFNNETGIRINRSTTINTTVLSYPLYNFTNISVTKTDNPDPVNASTNLTYQINISNTGNGTAYNVTVNDTYPPQVIYLTSQPTPLTGTNNTWNWTVLLPGTNISINITVFTLNVSNGTLINNTVNVSFNNETGTKLNRSTTINTTVLSYPQYNLSNISVVKTDSPDPVNVSSNLTYVINVTSNGNGTAYNVTVNDTYSTRVIYLTSSPAPLSGTNNTWILGNLTNGTSILINITVFTLNVSNGTLLNNTVNVSFNNQTGTLNNRSTTINTTVLSYPQYNFSNISLTKTDSPDPVNKSSNLTYQINITSNGNGTSYNVTVNDTYPLQAIYLTSSPTPIAGTNNTWIIGNLTPATSVLINITVLTLNLTNGTLINNTVNVSFNNETGTLLNRSTTINTTVLNRPPSIAQVILNTTDPLTNDSSQNLTAHFINVTDPDNDPVKNITDWRVNNQSMAVLNMPFEDDSSATFTKDYSTYGNNASVYNATWLQGGGYDGWGAYGFNGIDTFIEVNNSESLNISGDQITMAVWIMVKGHIAGQYERIVVKPHVTQSSPWNAYGLIVDQGGRPEFELGNSTLGHMGMVYAAPFPLNEWVFFVGRYNGTTATIYINGTPVLSTPFSGPLEQNNMSIFMGKNPHTTTEYFNGTLDEVRIWDRSLSDEEILALYQNKTDIMVSQEIKEGDIWDVCATPNDKLVDGNTVCSNYVAIKMRANFSNISVAKTDYPDPVNVSSNLTYVINVTSNGNGTAFNVTVNDTYPPQAIYLTSSPAPLAGTNNTWIIGNLTNGTSVLVNITVLVLNVTNGIVINNTVNVSFNNETGARLSANATANTTVQGIVPTLHIYREEPDNAGSGKVINVRFVIWNDNSSLNITDATLVDNYPAGWFVQGLPNDYNSSDNGWNVTVHIGGLEADQLVTFNYSIMAPSGTQVDTFSASVNMSYDNGNLTSTMPDYFNVNVNSTKAFFDVELDLDATDPEINRTIVNSTNFNAILTLKNTGDLDITGDLGPVQYLWRFNKTIWNVAGPSCAGGYITNLSSDYSAINCTYDEFLVGEIQNITFTINSTYIYEQELTWSNTTADPPLLGESIVRWGR